MDPITIISAENDDSNVSGRVKHSNSRSCLACTTRKVHLYKSSIFLSSMIIKCGKTQHDKMCSRFEYFQS